jgi:hypothetical protein
MTKFIIGCLVTFALLLAPAGLVLAGVEASLQREIERLQFIELQVRSLPAYQQSEELNQKIRQLQIRLKSLVRWRDNVERQMLTRQIDEFEHQLGAARKIITDFREAISHGERERFFPDVHHRLAVFTFDDPHATGLGDALSLLVSKKLLFSTRVRSFGIVNYRQGVDRDASGTRAYFDQVDALTQDQGFLLAIWGRISRTEGGVRIDSFLQVPTNADGQHFVRSIRLPHAMGGGVLTARLKPDRILLQSLEMGSDETGALQDASARVATLRAEPNASAEVTGRLAEGAEYTIVDSRRDWVRLRLRGGGGGWTSVDAFCTGACRTILDAANFTNDILALTSGWLSPPVSRKSLTREAAAVSDQLAALALLRDHPSRAMEIAKVWATGRSGGPPPGGAGFANLLAVARIKFELDQASASVRNFDLIRLNRAAIRDCAQLLAEASVGDPSDVDVVENLAVLFAYLGDERRRNLAIEIAGNLKARSR